MTRPISIPLRSGPRGYFAKAVDLDQEIRESLKQILFVNPGERFMRNDIGVPLRSFVFEPVDEIFEATAEAYGRAQIERFEPRVSLETISVTREEADTGGLVVYFNVQYFIPSTGRRDSSRLSSTFVRTANA